MSGRRDAVGRLLLAIVGGFVAGVAGYVLFVDVPDGNLARLLGILLAVATAMFGLRIAGRIARQRFGDYNVAEVHVEGPITRDRGSGRLPSSPTSPGADDVVELVEQADEDPNVGALLVHLNTPGGEVVPSDDIRLAAERFDGPTVAYATDVCASGGYWIASACDELWARDGSVVGSIGVRGSRFTATDLLDKLGVEYEPFTAGRYKEAGVPFEELDDDERAYLQGIVDEYYDQFVERVAAGRGLDPEFVRDTEARVYLGPEALELGLVDALGTREDVEAALADRLGEEVSVTQFEPRRNFAERLRGGAERVAYAVGAGVAGVVVSDDRRFRL